MNELINTSERNFTIFKTSSIPAILQDNTKQL